MLKNYYKNNRIVESGCVCITPIYNRIYNFDHTSRDATGACILLTRRNRQPWVLAEYLNHAHLIRTRLTVWPHLPSFVCASSAVATLTRFCWLSKTKLPKYSQPLLWRPHYKTCFHSRAYKTMIATFWFVGPQIHRQTHLYVPTIHCGESALWGKSVRPSWSLWGKYTDTVRQTDTLKTILAFAIAGGKLAWVALVRVKITRTSSILMWIQYILHTVLLFVTNFINRFAPSSRVAPHRIWN